MSSRWYDQDLYSGLCECDCPLRIVHVCKFFPPERGGMETYVHDLALEQAGAGHEVTVLAHTANQRLPGEKVAANCTLMRHKVLFYAGQYAPVAPALPLAMWRTMREAKPHILHIHCPNPAALWGLALPRGGDAAKLVVHWHSDVIFPEHKKPAWPLVALWRAMERRLLKRADRIIATSAPYLGSSEFLAPWSNKCKVSPLRISSVKPAVPKGFSHPAVDFLRAGETLTYPVCTALLTFCEDGQDRRVQHPLQKMARALPRDHGGATQAVLGVLAVGRFAHYKGFDILLKAVAKTRQVHCCIVGDGEEAPYLRKLVCELGLENRVLLPGELDDTTLAACYEACDVFCLPSLLRTEAFGVVLLEALRAKKWCIASNIPGSGISTVITHNENGWLVEPGDVDGLAARLDHFANEMSIVL